MDSDDGQAEKLTPPESPIKRERDSPGASDQLGGLAIGKPASSPAPVCGTPRQASVARKGQQHPQVKPEKLPLRRLVPRDSGYDSPGRSNTLPQPAAPSARHRVTRGPTAALQEKRAAAEAAGLAMPYHDEGDRVTRMIKQPESTPISPEQLATEVKGIYAGLVMVEAKCINIDAAQAADPKSQLTKDQWQALIALHRTLLYEHHDFLMATQHPTATPALRGLALKYSMPARMWKHGIHAFLEVLRHRRPESQDYMLAFIYLAYQMMALLFETVPSFTDTWIECLGDLARYRMAIEEEKEAHATWGGVAARWYTMASDRSPQVGRLYHHLGILERPSLRKLCFYVKSLTCKIPFTNARDSLATLCGPIVEDDKTIENSNQSLEAKVVTFFALICSATKDVSISKKVGNDALRLLKEQNTRLREIGPYLAIASIATLFERGNPINPLWRLFSEMFSTPLQHQQQSQQQRHQPPPIKPELEAALLSADTFQTKLSDNLSLSADFCYTAFNMFLQPWESQAPMTDHLAYVHIMMAWQHTLFTLRQRKSGTSLLPDTSRSLIHPSRVSWHGLAAFLNSLCQARPVTALILAHGREGTFPRIANSRPLSEDYLIRGLIWSQNYFEPDHFIGQSEDDGRHIETEAMRHLRADRVIWLGLVLAFRAELLHYNEETKVFSACANTEPTSEMAPSVVVEEWKSSEAAASIITEGNLTAKSVSCKRTSSSRSNSEDGFLVVKRPRGRKSGPPSQWSPAKPHADQHAIYNHHNRFSAHNNLKPSKKPAVADYNQFKVLDADNGLDVVAIEGEDDGEHNTAGLFQSHYASGPHIRDTSASY